MATPLERAHSLGGESKHAHSRELRALHWRRDKHPAAKPDTRHGLGARVCTRPIGPPASLLLGHIFDRRSVTGAACRVHRCRHTSVRARAFNKSLRLKRFRVITTLTRAGRAESFGLRVSRMLLYGMTHNDRSRPKQGSWREITVSDAGLETHQRAL
jgi:hypothetical protein